MRVRSQQWKGKKITKNHYLMEDTYRAQHFYQCLTNGTSKLGKVGRKTGEGQTSTLKGMLVKQILKTIPLSCHTPLLAPAHVRTTGLKHTLVLLASNFIQHLFKININLHIVF